MNLGVYEAELTEMNTNNEKLQRAYSELLEYKLVLQKVSICLDNSMTKKNVAVSLYI